jgi:hypothetical protein
MCHVCPVCGGKGWRWTGAARELCRGCLGSGLPRSAELHARGAMPQVSDPIKATR